MLTLRQWRRFALVAMFFGVSPLSYSDDGEKLLFAGFAFSGDYGNRQSLYPYSAAIASEMVGGEPLLDKVLREKLKAHPDLASRVSFQLDDAERESTSSVAFALVQENFEFQKVEGKYWVVLNLQSNVLAFNRASGSVVAAYPVRMRSTWVRDVIPSDHELRELVREAYLTPSKDKNIFDQWLGKFAKTSTTKTARKYLQVTDVKVKPSAEKAILDAGQNLSSIKNQVAILLEAHISSQSNVPIVPSSVGEAIGSKMACRFSNGESLNLDLPKPDYTLVFTVRDFVSTTVESPMAYQDIFRVKATISLTQPELSKTYLNEDIYDTRFVTRPKSSQIELTTWDQYAKTLQSLIATTSRQLAGVDDKWLVSNASRKLEAKTGFVNSNKVLQQLTY